jgi:hypothetical protein
MTDTNTKLRERLRECLLKVPPSVNSGSYQTAVKFKEWAAKANRMLSGSRAKERDIQHHINLYESFK